MTEVPLLKEKTKPETWFSLKKNFLSKNLGLKAQEMIWKQMQCLHCQGCPHGHNARVEEKGECSQPSWDTIYLLVFPKRKLIPEA